MRRYSLSSFVATALTIGVSLVAAGGAQAGVVNDSTPDQLVYDPGHPDANAQGYVQMPNV